jgi:D-alanyl-D-alanine carboxypeptidase (penicillin-binding protein 5/6)
VRRVAVVVVALLAGVISGRPAVAQTVPVPYTPPEPAGWILVDADTGAVLDGHAARAPALPASTIKLLTALIAVQRLPADDAVPISAVAEGMPARKINVKAGQLWDREDLLASMLLVSANDAAVALAERVGGGDLVGWERVAGSTALALGLEDGPDLSDPAGLDDEFSNGDGSRISPRDLAIIARNVLAEPVLMDIIEAEEIRFLGGDGVHHVVDRRNQLFTLYEGTIGMKTGLTDRAGRCLVAAATRDGRTMLAVMFDAPDMYATARLLLDQGFATPVEAQAGLEHLPDLVPGASLDPPERIPGAFDVAVTTVALPAERGGGLDWQSPPVAVALLVVGGAPALVVRRRLVERLSTIDR